MWKKTVLALFIASPSLWANQTPTSKMYNEAEVQQLKQE